MILIYGAHLLRNGAARILERMMERGWITHLATNGAGTIHDWEYAWLGRSTESVRANVATGTFGSWDETGRNIHLALLAGGLRDEGYGRALGRFIAEDGATLPPARGAGGSDPLRARPSAHAGASRRCSPSRHGIACRTDHGHAQLEARVDPGPGLWPPGADDRASGHRLRHHRQSSGLQRRRDRPGGRHDFKLFGGSVETLDGGVVLSIGSAIMGPQVFEKSLSCVNNLRLQDGRPIVAGHSIYVVDLQDGGGWDWTRGEPPKTNPAYYLRFCKSYSRMGGEMHYLQCDNAVFLHNLYHQALQA